MARPLSNLLYDARRILSIGSQGALGTLLGSSQRSGQRWERGEATPMHDQLVTLATMVFPRNAPLAAEIAATVGSTLEGLGIVRPPPPLPAPSSPAAVPAAPPPPDPIHIVDTVVCAAAEEMQLTPQAIRPALRAAFRRARLAGLSVEAVDAALSGPAPATDISTAKRGERQKKRN